MCNKYIVAYREKKDTVELLFSRTYFYIEARRYIRAPLVAGAVDHGWPRGWSQLVRPRRTLGEDCSDSINWVRAS